MTIVRVVPAPQTVMLVGVWCLFDQTTFGWICVIGAGVTLILDLTMFLLKSNKDFSKIVTLAVGKRQ